MNKNFIIAVDGFSSCGKSTFAKAIAQKLNLVYIDTGAMYRATTLYCMRSGCLKKNDVDLIKFIPLLNNLTIDFIKINHTSTVQTFLNNENVENEIRSIEVSEKVSIVSKIAEVRKKMVALQREMSKNKGVILDGRDIGTVVFPNANLKIFMTANVDVRAERRFKELKEKNQEVSIEQIKKNIEERDYIDQNREISPLKKADDAFVLDNSFMTPFEQLIWFDSLIEKLKLI